ncbi:hypothetical protein BH09VER1_BH09VER1_37630 [soil metagenome]
MTRLATGALLLVSAGALLAQDGQVPAIPEVRRAIPITRSTPAPGPVPEPTVRRALPVDTENYQNPGWMQQVATPTPAPAQKPPPGPEPGFTPFRPKARIEVAPSATPAETIPLGTSEAPPSAPAPEPQPVPAPPKDNDGDIRITPGVQSGDDAAKSDLILANGVYARKMYDLAIPQYEKFLISYPKSPGRDMAMFRLAECHRMLEHESAARQGYESLLQEFKDGEFAGAAAYRLGDYLYPEKKYDSALIQYQLAAAQAKGDEIRLSAKYDVARCLERLNRPAEAAKIYAEVAAVEKNNPFREYARLSVAEANASSGKKEDAMKGYAEIANGSAPANVRAEAGIKAAALAAELGDKKQALKLFKMVLALPDAPPNSGTGTGAEPAAWKAAAFLGVLRLSYDQGDYKSVVSMVEKPPDNLPDEAKAEILLLSGNSYKQLGNARAARAVFDRLIIQYPNSASTPDARFQRLISMYQVNDPSLLKETEDYLKKNPPPKERAQINLLKAETLFKQQNYAAAAPVYAELRTAPIDKEIANKVLYKLAWCLAQSKDYPGAIKAFTDYIGKNADSKTLPSAIVQRGIAYQQSGDYDSAIKDFNTLIAKYPGTTECELALQQKALVQGQQKDYVGMGVTFKKLLADFPKTSAAGQANFWLGWAADEAKDYKSAIDYLEAARKLDPKQYGERASLRIMVCYYNMQDRASLKRIISENKGITVPLEITRWLGRKAYEDADYEGAERYLQPVVVGAKNVEPDVLIEYAEAQIRQGKNKEAGPSVDKYLETAREPASRARGLIDKGYVTLSAKDFDGAQKICDEALQLQYEGRWNAEARLLAGEILFAREDYDGAGKAFETVAVLYDDPSVTPRSLKRASDAYKKSGNLMEAEKAQKELQQRFPDFQKSARITKDQ